MPNAKGLASVFYDKRYLLGDNYGVSALYAGAWQSSVLSVSHLQREYVDHYSTYNTTGTTLVDHPCISNSFVSIQKAAARHSRRSN